MTTDTLFAAMKDALSRARIEDPAAVSELAFDLAEVAAVWAPGEWPSPPTRTPRDRVARTMVRLRRRFASDTLPQYGSDLDEVETMPFFFEGKTGSDGFPLPTEVGLWAYFLDLTDDKKNLSKNPASDLRRWLNRFCDECLREEGRS